MSNEFTPVERLASVVQMTAQGAVAPGEIWQMRNGRAAFFLGLNAAAVTDTVKFERARIGNVPKTSGICFLDGGNVYWNWNTNAGHYKKGLNSRDFLLGTAVGDYTDPAATAMTVDLNAEPWYTLDLARDPWTTAVTGTLAIAGINAPYRRGGAHDLILDATNEAQKTDALTNDSFAAGAKGVLEFALTVVTGGAAGEPDFNLGLASATHATDADAIAQHLLVHVDGNSVNVNVQSKDGTHTLAATDTTVDYAAGTRLEGWVDFRVLTAVKIYLDGVDKTPATINVSSAAGAWKLLAHLEKTAAATTFEAYVDWLRVRLGEQSVNGV